MTPEEVLKTWKQTGQLIYPMSSPWVNDVVIYKGKKYLIIEKFAYTDLEYHYLLKPFKRGKTIEVTDGELRLGKYKIESNGCSGVICNGKDYSVRDDIWPSRLWTKDKTDYIDLSG